MPIEVTPIATVRSTRTARENDHWDKERATIELNDRLPEDALLGLDGYSHVEILFHFHQLDADEVSTNARHPRGNTDWPKVGILAQRNSRRLNRIGATICRIKRIDGRTIEVEGLDAIDGTPVLDIKPWVKEYEPRGEFFQPKWVTELMQQYWK